MTPLKEFHRQRAKVIIPKGPSLRPYRRMLRYERGPLDKMFRGIIPRPTRVAMAERAAMLNARHANVMDPFRFPERKANGRVAKSRRRGQAERLGRAAQVREVLSTLDLVHRSRGRTGFAPRPDWSQLPVAGR